MEFLKRHIAHLIMLLTIVLMVTVTMFRIEIGRTEANSQYKYDVYLDDHWGGYVNNTTTNKDGCIVTHIGKVCGSYIIKENRYYDPTYLDNKTKSSF